MRQRIAIDMDEVLADTVTHYLEIYRGESGVVIDRALLAGRKIHEVVREEDRESVISYLRRSGFFRHIPLMPGCREVLADLLEHYEVFITTAAMEFPNSFNEKYEWIREHLPFFPDSHIVFCGDKSVIGTDFLIDDSPRHFERFRGQGILFSAPHNRDETRYPRVNSWEDVRRMFLA